MELNKKNLTIFCIEKSSVRTRPGIASQLSVEFGLDWGLIKEGWMYVNALIDKQIDKPTFDKHIKELLEQV